MKKYSIGIDYGTLSARALLVDVSNGNEVAVSEYVYPHAVMTEKNFGLEISGADEMQLQHPADYLEALKVTVAEVLKKSGAKSDEVAGIGIDFTACTPLPVAKDGTPLCFFEKYKNSPHAYVKLWKHHGAALEAEEITLLAEKKGEEWLSSYGGKVSSEWLFPKLFEIYRKAPEIYADTHRFVEAADWLTFVLTEKEVKSSCMAGYKGLWNKKSGYPNEEFFRDLDEDFGKTCMEKVEGRVLPTGSYAGALSERGAELTGLCKGTSVAVPIIDAHAALPAAGITDAGKLMIIIGTSSCHIILDKQMKKVPFICGSVEDGIVEGFAAYEAGQVCVGDGFDWFIKNCVPESYMKKAAENNIGIFEYLDKKASALDIGENGVVALDWWNGNRTPYADPSLSGMLVGMTIATKPEDIYRAILESTAFGTKAIVELYEKHGVAVDEIYAAGGISHKNGFLMQMYADVLGKTIKIPSGKQAGAKGSAIFGAVAGGCFENAEQAAKVMADSCEKTYTPNLENTEKYQKLYAIYTELSEHFAKASNVMKKLKEKGE